MRREENDSLAERPEEDGLSTWVEDYLDPPEVPREEMWDVIASRLGSAARGRVVPMRRTGGRFGWPGLAAAATVVLAAGVGLGRMSMGAPAAEGDPRPGVSAGSSVGDGLLARAVPDGASTGMVRTVALDHLGRTGSFLSEVREGARARRVEAGIGRWGSGLLTETRLLLDSDAASDPELRSLLEDLELILAQVAVLPEEAEGDALSAEEELELIAKGVEDRDVLGRIDAVLPRNSGSEGS